MAKPVAALRRPRAKPRATPRASKRRESVTVYGVKVYVETEAKKEQVRQQLEKKRQSKPAWQKREWQKVARLKSTQVGRVRVHLVLGMLNMCYGLTCESVVCEFGWAT